MTTTLPTPIPAPPADAGGHGAAAEPHPAVVDRVLVERARTSADTLTGLIATGMLHTAAHPDRLPELLYPHLPPEDVRAIWDTALAVGYHAGQTVARRTWDPTDLDHARALLADAGYHALAAAAERAAYAAPSRPAPTTVGATHPADHTTPRTHP